MLLLKSGELTQLRSQIGSRRAVRELTDSKRYSRLYIDFTCSFSSILPSTRKFTSSLGKNGAPEITVGNHGAPEGQTFYKYYNFCSLRLIVGDRDKLIARWLASAHEIKAASVVRARSSGATMRTRHSRVPGPLGAPAHMGFQTYLMFLCSQSSINLMTTSLFLSRNISCILPWMPTSSRRIKSSFTPA